MVVKMGQALEQMCAIDALLAQLCVRHELEMLTTEGDFRKLAKIAPLSLWTDD